MQSCNDLLLEVAELFTRSSAQIKINDGISEFCTPSTATACCQLVYLTVSAQPCSRNPGDSTLHMWFVLQRFFVQISVASDERGAASTSLCVQHQPHTVPFHTHTHITTQLCVKFMHMYVDACCFPNTLQSASGAASSSAPALTPIEFWANCVGN